MDDAFWTFDATLTGTLRSSLPLLTSSTFRVHASRVEYLRAKYDERCGSTSVAGSLLESNMIA